MKGDLVVIGSSGHAKVVLDAIEREGRWRVVGLLDSFREPGGASFGYEILGAEGDLPRLVAAGVRAAFVAIGDNWQRHLMASKARALAPELVFASPAHPSAQVARGVEIGEGTVLMAGAVVQSASLVGRFCIVNTRASLDHDGVLGDFASLAPGVTAGGNVQIGDFAAVGIGATILHGRRIGEHSVVGAGAVVVHDVSAGTVAYGVPARVVRGRGPGDPYL